MRSRLPTIMPSGVRPLNPSKSVDIDPPCQLTVSDCFAAARAQSGHDLATLARKIEPLYTWDDIVLPADALAQLREICSGSSIATAC